MKRKYTLLWSIMLALTLVAAGCKKDSKKPVSERIAKTWTAETVKHGTTTVYTRGGAGNVQEGYSNFRLALSSTGTAAYTEFDKNTFNGTWALEGENTLVLSGLNPAPSGTNGTIKFTISSLEDTKVVLTRIDASVKTGNTINQYTLSNP
ncbi:hypothetical protein L0657_14795 [Dyadobacter sp. CY345]|uniref:hypothetical protein n=1 Tax=Dyadobacter sp. CY345 TaxID=2909335 RepID=UPI001F3C2170|nr:hypothetical protein [Dyadobacter sp. CY345]MCF2445234.1 hypothetical protein [Dyadobacter sp. CY345]